MKLRAPLITIVFVCLCFSDLHSQTLMPVYWETLDGELDSAFIRRRWRPVKDVDAYPLYAEFLRYDRELRYDVFISDMKWLRSGNSLLLKRVEREGQIMYLQLLYEGTVSLYEGVEEEARTYYLMYEDELRLLDKSDPRNTLLELVLGSCLAEKFPRRINGREAALALVRKVNDCLKTPGYRWLPGQFSRRFKVGVGYDWMTEETKQQYSFFKGFSRWQSYALEIPIASVTVNYTPWPASSWFTTDLQIRGIHFNHREEILLDNLAGRRQESLGLTNLYLYPGIRLQGSHRKIQPYFGFGAAFTLPLRFRYLLEFADPKFTHPGYPVREELRNGQNLQVGAYATVGVNLRLLNRIWLGIGLRTEWLYQDWQHYEQVSRRERKFLPYAQELAPNDWRFLQLQIAYGWK